MKTLQRNISKSSIFSVRHYLWTRSSIRCFHYRIPAVADIYKSRCLRQPPHWALKWSVSTCRCDLNVFLCKVFIFFQIITFLESTFEEAGWTANSSKKFPKYRQVANRSVTVCTIKNISCLSYWFRRDNISSTYC